MSSDSFFDESQEQSQIKAQIVAKYFWAWAKVVIPHQRNRGNKIAYVDLFAGPGRYKDGTKSTPLLILERAVKDPEIRDMLVSIFNDKDSNNTQTLSEVIGAIPGIGELKYPPQIHNEEVGERIVMMFEQMKLVPTLFFVDPWGYKGLSLGLVNSVLKDWGCDCIIFFNYNRINMGLSNDAVQEHMNALFGRHRARRLRREIESMPSAARELTVIECLIEAIKEIGGDRYVLPFCFKNEKGSRTSHHLIFVTKNVRGYEIMKEIMAKESSAANQGVPSFEYNPATRKQPLLFELSRPLDDLEQMLTDGFAGTKMTMVQIYNRHHVGRRYIKSNYKDVLLRLEADGKIATFPGVEARPKYKGKSTFGDNVAVAFPRKGKHKDG